MATFKIIFQVYFLILKNRNVEVSFSSINYSMWQKIVFQGTQKDTIVLLEPHSCFQSVNANYFFMVN